MLRHALLALPLLLQGAAAQQVQTVDEALATSGALDEEAKLVASDAAAATLLGLAVTLDGDRALIGAPSATDADGVRRGAAYVFVRSGDSWVEEAKLLSGDGVQGDAFGVSVVLDGDRALVGTQLHDSEAGANTGAVYVFVRSGTAWAEEAKLTANDAAGGLLFGGALALHGDRALVGATGATDPDGVGTGAAYVFVRTDEGWMEEAKLLASDGAAAAAFGVAVALVGDRALVGARSGDAEMVESTGAAYVFARSGATWTEEAKLTASDAAAFDEFGLSVALAGDRGLVGAWRDTNEAGPNAGAAYVFVRSGETWTEEAKLTATDAAPADGLGIAVAIDGSRALVGAWRDDTGGGGDAGSAYVFVRTGTVWTEEEKLTASDGGAMDEFGRSVALDGARVLAGAPRDDDGGSEAGAAYVFGLTPVAAENALVRGDLSIAVVPHPVRGTATVRYVLTRAGDVRLVFFDLLGREVATLARGTRLAGRNEEQIRTAGLPAGLYVLSLEAGAERATRKVLVVN